MRKILLADDHDLVRETIAAYLRAEGGMEVISAQCFDSAVVAWHENQPVDLVFLDFAMPGMDALDGLARMKAITSGPVAILSGAAPPETARRALRAGAAGFVPKTLAPQAMMQAVHQMLCGETYLPLEFLSNTPVSGFPEALTPRERDVLRGICDGKSNKEVARDLDIREVTVKLHLKTLSRKLGARNRTHAAMMARDHGLA